MAGYGLRSVTLKFDCRYSGKPAFNAPTSREGLWSSWHAYLGDREYNPFWVGPYTLPIDRVAGCVMELVQKAGITTTLVDKVLSDLREVELSW
jgi:hypothetical protein